MFNFKLCFALRQNQCESSVAVPSGCLSHTSEISTSTSTRRNGLVRGWLILRVRMPGIRACAYLTSVNQALNGNSCFATCIFANTLNKFLSVMFAWSHLFELKRSSLCMLQRRLAWLHVHLGWSLSVSLSTQYSKAAWMGWSGNQKA